MWKDVSAPYSKFESWFYDSYIAPAMVPFLDQLQEELGIDLPEKGFLLDVGCGGGQILGEIAEKFPLANLFGADLSEEQVERANHRLASYKGRVQIRQGSALNLPFPADKFDLVLSNGSIKHWPDQGLGLSECVRVLKPGGRLLIIEADRGCRQSDVDRLFAHSRIPSLFRPLFRTLFLLKVSGPSLDMDDTRELAGNLALAEWSVSRIKNLPGWVLDGIK
ncbi:MAG: class I SAM-dependent methyltransferase [Desulfatibacillum sp.]|nr:class I SAM-dependent methyltransferase [Desulfatibacillum sp.]